MTESQSAYLSVPCPNCGKPVGDYRQVDGQIWLRIGSLTCRVVRATCDCGSPFDFDASGKKLERLLERRQKAKDML